MEELSKKQGLDLIRKLRQSTDVDEILEISQKLGMDFGRQSATEYAETNRRIAALDEPQYYDVSQCTGMVDGDRKHPYLTKKEKSDEPEPQERSNT